MSNPIAAWHQEHAYFQRLLALLQEQVDVFAEGGSPNYDLMLDVISYLTDYADHVHHPREDEAFLRIARNCPDLVPVIARLQQEHRVIRIAGERLRVLLQEAADDAIVPRSEIEVAAATYLVYYGNHIAKEDEDILGRAANTLRPEDWADVRKAVPEGADPLRDADTGERFRELRRQIALEA